MQEFTPATISSPPEGVLVEGCLGRDVFRCRKRDGVWQTEAGETIQISGWRMIEAAPEEPNAAPKPEQRAASKRKLKPARKRTVTFKKPAGKTRTRKKK